MIIVSPEQQRNRKIHVYETCSNPVPHGPANGHTQHNTFLLLTTFPKPLCTYSSITTSLKHGSPLVLRFQSITQNSCLFFSPLLPYTFPVLQALQNVLMDYIFFNIATSPHHCTRISVIHSHNFYCHMLLVDLYEIASLFDVALPFINAKRAKKWIPQYVYHRCVSRNTSHRCQYLSNFHNIPFSPWP